jgi:hypothetical protein
VLLPVSEVDFVDASVYVVCEVGISQFPLHNFRHAQLEGGAANKPRLKVRPIKT